MSAVEDVGTERGESLLEILLSVMIIGIAVTAILGGVGLAARASTQDERTIHAQALLRSWGEHIQARTTDVTYVPCAGPGAYRSGSPWWYATPAPDGLETLPPGFTPDVVDVDYWVAGTWSDTKPSTCSSSPAKDAGLQRLEITMAVAAGLYPGFTATYDVVLRKPCAAIATATVAGC